MGTNTTNLGLLLQADGDNPGSWGDKTNTNLQILEQAVTGLVAITVTSGDYTLTHTSGVVGQQAQYGILQIFGALTGNVNILLPAGVQKSYIVTNATTNTGATAYSVTFKISGGSGSAVSVSQGNTQVIYTGGTNVFAVDPAGSWSGVVPYTFAAGATSYTVSSGQFGCMLEFGASVTGGVATIPSPIGVNGATLGFYNNSTYPVSITTSAGYFFGQGVATGSPTTIAMRPDTTTVMLSDGYNWLVYAGQRTGGSLASAVLIATGTTSIDYGYIGKLLEFGDSTARTVTIPTASNMNGAAYYLVNNGSGTQTLTSNGFFFNGASSTTLPLTNNQSVMLVSDGFNWCAFDGSWVIDKRLTNYALQTTVGSLEGFNGLTTSSTLTTTQFGQGFAFGGTAAITTTLPTAVGNAGATFYFINNTSNASTQTLASNGFFFNGASGTTLALAANQSVMLVSDNYNWCAFGGSWVVDQRVIGVGQAWTVLSTNLSTGSRVFNTTYTNTTGKPIQVMISLYTGSGTSNTGQPYANGVAIAGFTQNSLQNGYAVFSFIVPVGGSYSMSGTNWSTSGNNTTWAELR